MVSRVRTRSAEKPVGRWDKRSNVATNRLATKRTRKQKATCKAIKACIKRRRECGSSPPLSVLTGLIAEARTAGSRPNRKVTPRVSTKAKAKTRQSAGRNSRAGLSGGLILLTTNGAAHHANNPPKIGRASCRER